MKRYKVEWGHLVEDPNGEWVKYEDVEKEIDDAYDNGASSVLYDGSGC